MVVVVVVVVLYRLIVLWLWLWLTISHFAHPCGKVIGQQQKAELPGNLIESCIINILNLMKHTNRKKIESLILLINFRKAFNSLSHNYIDGCNREAYILLGGELTKKILLEQGVPQGDVVSQYVLILAVELLLIQIINTKLIEGITYAKK